MDSKLFAEQSREFLEDIAQTVRHPLVVLDRDLVVVSVNRSYCREFQVRPEEAQGRSLFDLGVGLWRIAELEAALARLLSEGGEARDLELTHGSGLRTVVNARRLQQPLCGERILMAIEDVTSRPEPETRPGRTPQDRLEAIGRLAGGIAHDFNNMLSAILGYAELALQVLEEETPAWKYVETIHSAGERSAALTRQLLAFSRRQMLTPQVIDLGELVASTEPMLSRVMGEAIEVRISRSPDLGQVELDPDPIHQALINLAINARDAMPRGGRLTLESSNVDLEAGATAAALGLDPGRYVALTVSDTGVGMDQATLERVFEPFFTTKPAGLGTGLGLAGVHGFVKQSGGSICASSQPGIGSTFELYFPRVEGEPQPPSPVLARWPLLRGTETILLVEDNALVRGLVREALESSGFDVLEAGDGLEALEVCASHPGRIHLIFTDVVMPKMGGKELVESLPPERSDAKVIFTSGYDEGTIARRGVLDEGAAFLPKPVTPKDLIQKIREVLDTPPGGES